MKVYKVVRSIENGNLVVVGLNAAVLPHTFKIKEGNVLADLYKLPNSANRLVGHKTCPPVNSEFLETVLVTFE